MEIRFLTVAPLDLFCLALYILRVPTVPVRPLVLDLHHQQAQQGHRYEDDQAVVHPVESLQYAGRLQAEHPEEESGEQPAHLAPSEGGEGL